MELLLTDLVSYWIALTASLGTLLGFVVLLRHLQARRQIGRMTTAAERDANRAGPLR